jgi:hypothetical protein
MLCVHSIEGASVRVLPVSCSPSSVAMHGSTLAVGMCNSTIQIIEFTTGLNLLTILCMYSQVLTSERSIPDFALP